MKKFFCSKKLTPQQLQIIKNRGTEPPFSGKLLHNKKAGTYLCAQCGARLFSSEKKYDSGTGWPSFFDVVDRKSIATERDDSLMAQRTEVHCAKCGGHLGHLFADGPPPTGKRYCINSLALDFEQRKNFPN